MLPPWKNASSIFFPFLHFTCLHEDRQRLAIKQQNPASKKKKKKSKKDSRVKMEGIASRRLRRAINVVKNELRPKGSTCTTSLSPSTRDTAITSRPRLILFDQWINQLDVIYHASLCFISSFVRSMLDCTIEYLHLGKKGLPSTILFSRVFRLNWRKTKERSSLHRIQSYRFIHSFPPTMDKALLSG